MHTFPSAAALEFLVGLEVGQICLDPWSTQIRFSDGGQITIEGPFEHVDAEGRAHIHQASDEQSREPVFLRDLIQQRITSVERIPARLTLAFGNGAVLRISSEAAPVESGQIYPPGQEDNPIVF